MPSSLLLPGEAAASTLPRQTGACGSRGRGDVRQSQVAMQKFRFIDRGGERIVEFPVNAKDDISGVIASANSGRLQDFQDKLKVIQLRERGLSKAEISEKVGRSEHWVKRWWREHPATLERPAGANDVVMKKASLSSFRDLDIRRQFHDDSSVYDKLVKHMTWRQAKVVARDPNSGELGLAFDRKGRAINAGRQVADYSGGLDFLDKLLQKVFKEMDIRDQSARIFMNWYADGQDRTGTHRHDFWTCLLSFGAPRILTVDNKPVLLRDNDLIVFGTQMHGVPVMPDASGGRISLVIFFYPDADNLERQWQTITENDDDQQETHYPDAVGASPVGLDKGFDAAMLWGERTSSPASEGLAFQMATDPTVARGSLFQSPNSELQFAGKKT